MPGIYVRQETQSRHAARQRMKKVGSLANHREADPNDRSKNGVPAKAYVFVGFNQPKRCTLPTKEPHNGRNKSQSCMMLKPFVETKLNSRHWYENLLLGEDPNFSGDQDYTYKNLSIDEKFEPLTV